MADILELMGGILRKLDETVAKFDLCQLKQHESVDEYFNSFDLITSKFHLSEEFKVKWFVKGLKEDISLIVNYFEPSSLQRALELAKLQEQALEMMRSMYKERIEAENVQEDELKEKEEDRGGCEFFEKQIDQVFGEDVDDDLNPKEISTFGSIFHSASISMDPEGTLEKNNYTRPNEEMEANVIRVQDVIDKNELRGMSVDEIILSQSDQFDFQEATSIANTDINKYRNFLTTEGNNDMYISSMAPEIYMVDEVFDALIPEIDVFLMNSRLVPGFLDKLSLRNGEESEILFEYKEVSSKDIEKQLIKRGFKVSNFQVDEFKKLSGVVEIMNRRMLINIKLFSNASDIFVGCASKVSKQRGNIPWVIPAHYLIYNSSDDPSLRKVEGVMEVDVLKMEQPKYIPGGMTFKDKNKLQYNQALEDNFFIGKWNQVQVPLSEIPTKQSSKRHLHNSVEVHLIFKLKDGKNGSQGIYKALGKIILIIWGWFYKESEDLFKKLIENLRIELYQRFQFYLHPGCWNIQWAIAWNSEWKIKNWEEWLCVLEDLLHWFQFCAKVTTSNLLQHHILDWIGQHWVHDLQRFRGFRGHQLPLVRCQVPLPVLYRDLLLTCAYIQNLELTYHFKNKFQVLGLITPFHSSRVFEGKRRVLSLCSMYQLQNLTLMYNMSFSQLYNSSLVVFYQKLQISGFFMLSNRSASTFIFQFIKISNSKVYNLILTFIHNSTPRPLLHTFYSNIKASLIVYHFRKKILLDMYIYISNACRRFQKISEIISTQIAELACSIHCIIQSFIQTSIFLFTYTSVEQILSLRTRMFSWGRE